MTAESPLQGLRPGPPGPGARLLTRLIRLYQAARSGRPSPCRFFPSCSAYALEAVEVHGAVRGGGLALRRLGRCHPWGAHGIDLVPERPDRSPHPPEVV